MIDEYERFRLDALTPNLDHIVAPALGREEMLLKPIDFDAEFFGEPA
jgi:hypothetical protein